MEERTSEKEGRRACRKQERKKGWEAVRISKNRGGGSQKTLKKGGRNGYRKHLRKKQKNPLYCELECVRLSFCLKVHKIEIFFGFDFENCIISLLVM